MKKIECVSSLTHEYSQSFLQLGVSLLLDSLACILSHSTLMEMMRLGLLPPAKGFLTVGTAGAEAREKVSISVHPVPMMETPRMVPDALPPTDTHLRTSASSLALPTPLLSEIG